MKSLCTPVIISFCIIFFSITQHANAQCCTPDSLKVKSKTDSSFCVQWHVSDSTRCDSVRAFQFQYRPTPQTNWITRTRLYHHDTTLVYCDTATACRTYNWRVRNVCIIRGDTVYSAFVNGPNFTLPCHFLKSRETNQYNIAITPNPAKDKITLNGDIKGNINISISNTYGKEVAKRSVNITSGKLRETFNLSTLNSGSYFVTVSNKTTSQKLTFIKE